MRPALACPDNDVGGVALRNSGVRIALRRDGLLREERKSSRQRMILTQKKKLGRRRSPRRRSLGYEVLRSHGHRQNQNVCRREKAVARVCDSVRSRFLLLLKMCGVACSC